MVRVSLAALLAIAMPVSASAQALPCIARDQAAALVTFALPSLVQGVAQRCAAVLPPSSYLLANAGRMADRYRADAGYSWPQARTVIARLFTEYLGQEMPPEMDGDLVRTMAEPMLGGLLAKRVATADCALVDGAASQLAPLSGRAVGKLAVIGALAADRKDKGIAGVLHICRPPAPRRIEP